MRDSHRDVGAPAARAVHAGAWIGSHHQPPRPLGTCPRGRDTQVGYVHCVQAGCLGHASACMVGAQRGPWSATLPGAPCIAHSPQPQYHARQWRTSTSQKLVHSDIWALVYILQHRTGQTLWSHQYGHSTFAANDKVDAWAKKAATHALQLRPCVHRKPRGPLASLEARKVWPDRSSPCAGACTAKDSANASIRVMVENGTRNSAVEGCASKQMHTTTAVR